MKRLHQSEIRSIYHGFRRSGSTLVLGLLLAISACHTTRPEPQSTQTSMRLRVMTFNIEWGGTHIDFEKVVEVVRLSKADIVGIQEAEGNLRALAGKLGWHYDLRNYAISRYPLIEPPGADGKYVYVEVTNGKIVALANVHLPSDPYGPYAIRDGASLEEVLELERHTRLPFIATYLDVLPPLFERNIPVFLTGDFNAPAHTDWTENAVVARAFYSYAVPWPVSTQVTKSGFQDSFRTVNPDPISKPGFTWWAGRPPLALYTPDESDPHDRIDFVWYAGPATVQSSEIIGEMNSDDVSISVAPWPSDHRAVVSTFDVIPASMPELVNSARRVYQLGEDVEVIYHHLRSTPPDIIIKRLTANGTETVVSQSEAVGPLRFDGRLFSPGHYQVSMGSSFGRAPLVKDFWVLAKNATPVVEVVGQSFKPGEPIEFTWNNAPGNRNDYVAVYDAITPVAYGGGLAWTYIDALPSGRKRLDGSNSQWGWPLPPGRYVLRLIKDDGYEQMGVSTMFIVDE